MNKEQNPEAKHKELKAQILYRLEKFSECFELYKDLIKNTEDDYEAERETNLLATVACLSLEGTVRLNLSDNNLIIYSLSLY